MRIFATSNEEEFRGTFHADDANLWQRYCMQIIKDGVEAAEKLLNSATKVSIVNASRIIAKVGGYNHFAYNYMDLWQRMPTASEPVQQSMVVATTIMVARGQFSVKEVVNKDGKVGYYMSLQSQWEGDGDQKSLVIEMPPKDALDTDEESG